jgi:predicted Rossmann-fold nucleotide-binding protein
VLFGREYWSRVVDFQFLADEGVIADTHLNLISFAETPAEAWDRILSFHSETAPVTPPPVVAPQISPQR